MLWAVAEVLCEVVLPKPVGIGLLDLVFETGFSVSVTDTLCNT